MIAPALFLYLDLGTFGGFLAQFAINQLSGKVVIGAGAANEQHVWMAPAKQDIFEMICAFVRSSHVSGLFARF